MQKKDFTIQELKENPSFRRMVRGIASAEEIEIWNQWIKSSDENRMKAKDALSEMVGFEFRAPAAQDIEKEWSRLRAETIGKSRKPSPPFRREKDNALRWIFRAVAIILLVSFVGIGTYQFSEEDSTVPHLEQLTAEKTITTEEGEQKTLKFSNGSKVILNSYSSLTYRLGDSKNSTIELTLDGEAWFDADPNRVSDQPAFAVMTPDGIIRDIGTEFLVTVENGHSRVVLQEGLVEVEAIRAQDKIKQKSGNKFRVGINEMVEFSSSDVQSRVTVNPTFYSSWATGFMRLDNTNIKEFAYHIEQQFNVEVVLINKNISDVALNGTVYFRSLKELVRSVSEVIEIPVSHSNDRKVIYIGK